MKIYPLVFAATLTFIGQRAPAVAQVATTPSATTPSATTPSATTPSATTPSAVAAAPETSGPLSLEESIRIALANNGQTGASTLQAQAARQNITSARAAGLPQITGNIGYNYLNQRSSVFVPNFNGGVNSGRHHSGRCNSR